MPYGYMYFYTVLPMCVKNKLSERTTNELTVVYGTVIVVTDFSNI